MEGLKGLKGISKSRDMKRLRGIGARERQQPPQAPDVPPVTQPDRGREEELAQALGDDELARRVVKLTERFPYGTVPEMLAMDWLDKNLADYVYQAQVNGGYRQGGQVPDFVVKQGDRGIALLIQGDYWHNVPGKRQADEADRIRLRGQYYQGVILEAVIWIWESLLMQSKQRRDEVMAAALQRQEIRP